VGLNEALELSQQPSVSLHMLGVLAYVDGSFLHLLGGSFHNDGGDVIFPLEMALVLGSDLL